MLKAEKYTSLKGSRTRVLFYEIGTGLLASEISSLFTISSFSFSPNGKFFVAGSKSGCVSIWAIGDNLFGNITNFLKTIEVQRDIWSSYPLYIKNEYIDEIDEINENNVYFPLKDNLQKAKVIYSSDYPHEHQHKFERLREHETRKRKPAYGSPAIAEHYSHLSDHEKLLKQREKKFLRKPGVDSKDVEVGSAVTYEEKKDQQREDAKVQAREWLKEEEKNQSIMHTEEKVITPKEDTHY
jgi:hypothetical protein